MGDNLTIMGLLGYLHWQGRCAGKVGFIWLATLKGAVLDENYALARSYTEP
jgi:hypothetical protein